MPMGLSIPTVAVRSSYCSKVSSWLAELTLGRTRIRGLAHGDLARTVAFSATAVLETCCTSNKRKGSSWKP